MGLCASKEPQTGAAASTAATGPRATTTDEDLLAASEARDVVSAAPPPPPLPTVSALDPALSASAPSLLRKEQSVVGALPVFTKTNSNGSRRGVPISDLPPQSPSATARATAGSAPPPPPPPALAHIDGDGDATPSGGQRSKGYDPLERPSRSALRTPSHAGDTDDTAASSSAAAGAAVAAAGAATAAAATAAAAAGPSSASRKSVDSAVKFRGLPGGEEGQAAAAAAAAGPASVGGGSQRSLARVTIDAEDADPETAARRAALDHQSKTWSMKAVVDRHYERVWADPLLRPFFERVDRDKLKRHQEAAFALAFGGQELLVALEGAPGGAPPSDLRAIHRRQIAKHGLGLTHFDAFVEHFAETVEAIPAIPEDQRRTAVSQLRATRPLFGPLTDAERAALEEEDEKKQKGGGRRRFLLFGRRVGAAT